jgi:hypothetical protein
MDQPELRVRRRGFLGEPFYADPADHDHDTAEGVRVRTRRTRRRLRPTSRRDRRPPVAKISRRERVSTAANRA